MGSFETTTPKPGVVIYRLKGAFSADDLNAWRDHLLSFFKDGHKKGACGVLVDARRVEGVSTEALDTLCEILAEPPEEIQEVRTRFAFVGVRRYTERFMRGAMPITKVSHLRGRFFHEVAEEEAIAWLSAMVESAGDLPDVQPVKPSEEAEPVPADKDEQRQKKEKETAKELKQEKEEKKEEEKPKEKEKEASAPAKPDDKPRRLPFTLRRG